MSIPFAPGPAGLPNGFSIARTGKGGPATWASIADPGVPGGYVLAQTSTDQTDYRFPLAIYDPLTAANLDASVRFKAVAGRIDRAGGLAIRLTDADNYYVVRANALENNVNFYRVVQGSRREIKGAATKVTSDTWHSLSVNADGDSVRYSVRWQGSVHRGRSHLHGRRQDRALDQGRQRDAFRPTRHHAKILSRTPLQQS